MGPPAPPRASRREVLAAGTAILGALADRATPFGAADSPPTGWSPQSPTRSDTPATATEPATTATPRSPQPPLHVQTSPELGRVVESAAADWNRNPLPSADDWAHHLDADPDRRLAESV